MPTCAHISPYLPIDSMEEITLWPLPWRGQIPLQVGCVVMCVPGDGSWGSSSPLVNVLVGPPRPPLKNTYTLLFSVAITSSDQHCLLLVSLVDCFSWSHTGLIICTSLVRGVGLILKEMDYWVCPVSVGEKESPPHTTLPPSSHFSLPPRSLHYCRSGLNS